MPVSRRRVSSGLEAIDAFLGGGYPVGAITRVVSAADTQFQAWDQGRRRLINAALHDDERYAQYLRFPRTGQLLQAIHKRKPDLLVIDGWNASAHDITSNILRVSTALKQARVALLMFDNRDNAIALRFWERVRFQAHFEEAHFSMTCIKTVLNARQGHELVF